MNPILRLAVPVLAAALLVACDRGDTPAATSTPTATPSPAATVTATPTSTPSAATTATATATASRTPAAFPTGPAGPTPPPGYAASCAAAFPWGRQVTRQFVCIEEPREEASVSRGGTLLVRGYAGGSFENNVVVEVRLVGPGGSLAAGTLVQAPQTYVAPDSGMPGYWQATFTLPAGGQPSDARVIAHFESPKDGARVAEAGVDITIR